MNLQRHVPNNHLNTRSKLHLLIVIYISEAINITFLLLVTRTFWMLRKQKCILENMCWAPNTCIHWKPHILVCQEPIYALYNVICSHCFPLKKTTSKFMFKIEVSILDIEQSWQHTHIQHDFHFLISSCCALSLNTTEKLNVSFSNLKIMSLMLCNALTWNFGAIKTHLKPIAIYS